MHKGGAQVVVYTAGTSQEQDIQLKLVQNQIDHRSTSAGAKLFTPSI